MTPLTILADLIANHIDTDILATFKASDEVHEHFYDLVEKEKRGYATSEEVTEIEQFMYVERVLQLAKAKIRQHAGQ